MTAPAKAVFEQEVLDQVAIFNEIITYLKAHVITSISSETNQYFETVDCKYEYVDKKLTITVKPSSAIYPKIQSLKVDVLNKFDVQVDCKDVVEVIEKLEAMFGQFNVCDDNIYPYTSMRVKDKTIDDSIQGYYKKSAYEMGTITAVIHLADIHNDQMPLYIRKSLNRLTTLNPNMQPIKINIRAIDCAMSTRHVDTVRVAKA